MQDELSLSLAKHNLLIMINLLHTFVTITTQKIYISLRRLNKHDMFEKQRKLVQRVQYIK